LTLTTAWCLGLALGFGLWLRLSIFSIFWLVIMVILYNVVVITFPVCVHCLELLKMQDWKMKNRNRSKLAIATQSISQSLVTLYSGLSNQDQWRIQNFWISGGRQCRPISPVVLYRRCA